jgi:hypothetical protein
MDYSSLSQDPDHPAGGSPWGSPSPRKDRASSSDAPSPPLPPQLQSPYGPDDGIQGRIESSSPTPGRDESNEPGSPDLSNRLQGAQLNDPDRTQQQGAQHHKPQTPARYQTGARQNSKQQSAPQYRLQAKITGLERTGKKDPILRFDVHVSVILIQTN